MKQRKKKKQQEYLLLDKSVLRLLSPKQRKTLDSPKRPLICPLIQIEETARHGLDSPNALLTLKNTVIMFHWAVRAKDELLMGHSSLDYKIGAKFPLQSIYEESEEERGKMKKRSIETVEAMEADADALKKHVPILGKKDDPLFALAKTHRCVLDADLVREFNQANRKSRQNKGQSNLPPIPKGIGNKKIPIIRKYLDDYKQLCTVDSLEKSYNRVIHMFSRETKFGVLQLICNGHSIPMMDDEKETIFQRYKNEEEPPLNRFAPYALMATTLYFTIFLYLLENSETSSPREILRDYDYLFYAMDDNITFVSSDKWHKKCIDEIPLLNNVRKKFKYIPHKNQSELELKKALRSIGIHV